MKNTNKSWLQLYVDAVTERDAYKRLALVRELKQIPKWDESEEAMDGAIDHRMEHRPEHRPARRPSKRPSKGKTRTRR